MVRGAVAKSKGKGKQARTRTSGAGVRRTRGRKALVSAEQLRLDAARRIQRAIDFPIQRDSASRRSGLRTKNTGKLEEYRQVQLDVAKDYLTIDRQPDVGLEARLVEGIAGGRAVFATQTIPKDTYVCEYAGDYVDDEEAERRAAEYLADPATHSWYMFHFRHENKPVCVDATQPTALNALSRLINHSRTKPLLRVKVVVARGVPRLAMFAKRDIEVGEELRFDYGDRSKAALAAHPWLGE